MATWAGKLVVDKLIHTASAFAARRTNLAAVLHGINDLRYRRFVGSFDVVICSYVCYVFIVMGLL
jgi:hypothetical protein